jgi:NADH-quinone oxidoreductase subunit H
MISFEILLFLIFFILIIIIERYSLNRFINFQLNIKFIILIYPLYIIFFIRILIDLNRVPFDLIEGESELVSGFNIEYFRRLFVLIFLSEYINIIFISILITIIFYGLIN